MEEGRMKKPPEEMTICNLQVLLMPNGELLCLGKTVGWFKEFKKYLVPVTKSGAPTINPRG